MKSGKCSTFVQPVVGRSTGLLGIALAIKLSVMSTLHDAEGNSRGWACNWQAKKNSRHTIKRLIP